MQKTKNARKNARVTKLERETSPYIIPEKKTKIKSEHKQKKKAKFEKKNVRH